MFIGQVHKHLPRDIYAEKTHNPYRAGIPDCYYESSKRVSWIEYKWRPKIRFPLVIASDSRFTRLQQEWLKRAHNNSLGVALIIGSSDGALVLPHLEWLEETKQRPLLSNPEVAQWISNFLA